LIEALLKAPREYETEGEEEPDDSEHLDDVDPAVIAWAFTNEFTKRPSHPDCEDCADDADGAAGEGVLGSLADEDAEIHGTLDDDDVCQRERKEKENADSGEDDPPWDVLTDFSLSEDGDDGEDEEGREAD
jgi:hypothetical protein